MTQLTPEGNPSINLLNLSAFLLLMVTFPYIMVGLNGYPVGV